MASTTEDHTTTSTTPSKEEEHDQTPAEEEDTGAQIAPIVRLEEVAVTTGEEDEDTLLDLKSKLYRFDKDGNQWKERGSGTVKFLKHKVSGKVRLVMRQSKTLKICANHLIIAGMTVQEHAGNEKSCVWHASDYADGELKEEMFCIRFASIENCKSFMEMFQEIAESQKKLEDNEDASETAEALEKLSVGEEKNKNNTSEEKAAPAKEAATSAEEAKESSAAPEEAKEAEPKKDDVEKKSEDSTA